ncbi:META domain-containing protein [Vibrio sp. WJH972]
MQFTVKSLCFSVALVATLSACSSNGGQATTDNLAASQWVLVEIDGQALSLGPNQKAPWLSVDQQMQAKGYAGCNTFFGEANIQGDQFSLPKMGSTMKLCNKAQNRLDNKLRKVLTEWSSFSVKNDEMVLINRDHSLTFKSK